MTGVQQRAFLIGLTATPSKRTIGVFNRDLVTETTTSLVVDGVKSIDQNAGDGTRRFRLRNGSMKFRT